MNSYAVPKSSQTLPQIRNFQRAGKAFYWPSYSNYPHQPLAVATTSEGLLDNPGLYLRERDLIGESRRSHHSRVYAEQFERDAREGESEGERVEDHLAVKAVPCDNVEQVEDALKEAVILREHRHNHLVALVGTYLDRYRRDGQDSFKLGLVLAPLAKCNLHEKIEALSKHNANRVDDPDNWRPNVQAARLFLQFFPCLCRTLLYLHYWKIKHRDAKPNNILIDHEENAIIADFDTSHTYLSAIEAYTRSDGDWTLGYASGKTKAGELQGFCKDINSLGFVLLEMISVALGETKSHLIEYLSTKSQPAGQILTNNGLEYSDALSEGKIDGWIRHLKGLAEDPLRQVPVELFTREEGGEHCINDFLDKIMDLMTADDDQTHACTLHDSAVFFSDFVVKCQHCHPDKNPVDQKLPDYVTGRRATASNAQSTRSRPPRSTLPRPSQSTLQRPSHETISTIAEGDLTEDTDDNSYIEPLPGQHQLAASVERPLPINDSISPPRVWIRRGDVQVLSGWDLVSRKIVVYSPLLRVCSVVENEMIQRKRGVLIPLHKFDDTVIVFPSHTLHLSQKLDRTAQLMRSIGHIRYMFIYEEFATNDLDGMQVI